MSIVNKTRAKFSSVTQVLSIFLATAATSASIEKANSKERLVLWLATCFRKLKVPGLNPTASYAQR